MSRFLILNGTSAQLGYTVPIHVGCSGKYRTEDKSKTRKQGGLILQCSWAHSSSRLNITQLSMLMSLSCNSTCAKYRKVYINLARTS